MVCLVLVLLPGSTVTALAGWPRGLLQSALAPMSQLFGQAGWSGDGPTAVVSDTTRAPLAEGPSLDYLRALEDENRRLRLLVEQLAESNEMLTRPAVRQVLAPVLALAERNVGMTVGVGERSGVAPDDTVVSGPHLIGRVSNVAPLTSDIDPIARPGVRLQVRIVPATELQPNREVFAWVDYDRAEGAFVAELKLNAEVEAGDIAHLVDDRWPLLARGRVVGVVTKLDDRTSKPLLLKRVVIAPERRVENLRRVVVLVERAQQGGTP
ncbi:rod shape-determining protein MreC [Mucisphaera calidilacus]|uniref:Cell shape-determining protein MreC n=1 Tax=Mucisphaera calidilacus TaxID=2527982 RepID=A0A518BZC0_9BACT|nr:rod shape-determining protein MreC [Mucisphaera calidilacus]QDU72320.1 Cell shape-determining protein MreC [Mucisphaera calidilacus]